MKCPKCGEKKTVVINSRHAKNFTKVTRRRSCRKCHFRFTTAEKQVELTAKQEDRKKTHLRLRSLLITSEEERDINHS